MIMPKKRNQPKKQQEELQQNKNQEEMNGKKEFHNSNESIQIIVVGDIGRSPRMQLQAQSFASAGYEVHLGGFSGSELRSAVIDHANIKVNYIHKPPHCLQYLPLLLAYPLKMIFLLISILCWIIVQPKCDWLLIQCPPSLPTLQIAWFMQLIGRRKICIDWHNYGFTLAPKSAAKIYRFLEFTFASHMLQSALHLCVSDAMRHDLKQKWNINAITLRDKPAPDIAPCDLSSTHRLFVKLQRENKQLKVHDSSEFMTAITHIAANGCVQRRPDRPAIIVSSTSWTQDEDFSILLNALTYYDNYADNHQSLPDIICIVTGKGPLKEYYLKEAAKRNYRSVRLLSLWLQPQDYPLILASADIGICLHTSSSGVDLPMKIVDMFGAGLPTLALKYSAIDELLHHGENGFIFNSANELAELLFKLLPNHQLLAKLKNGTAKFRSKNFIANWNCIMPSAINSHNMN